MFAGLSWVVGDAEELPFDDDQFDIYTIAFGIRNVTHIEQVRTLHSASVSFLTQTWNSAHIAAAYNLYFSISNLRCYHISCCGISSLTYLKSDVFEVFDHPVTVSWLLLLFSLRWWLFWQALQEALRVLKPGGRFMCLEFSKVTNPLLARSLNQCCLL